ncbi:MAG: fumarylacetoacetate hydrolase family protein [Deltaproteobacteria bacterium]|nr:fumarylacetoacetate hydrolase family protein [Deltaproteobacteria bacterium]
MRYKHFFMDGAPCGLPAGKAVCVARNYLDHIKELRNEVPDRPVFFIKPETSLCALDQPIDIPAISENCHFEVELAVLIAKKLKNVSVEEAMGAIAGYGIGLDMTLRDIQSQLKEKGHPWEIAKGFDGACPLSPFLRSERLTNPQDTRLRLWVNGILKQDGSTREMITPIGSLLSEASNYFSLLAGDILLTGTPAGVDRIKAGDRIELELDGKYRFETRVR